MAIKRFKKAYNKKTAELVSSRRAVGHETSLDAHREAARGGLVRLDSELLAGERVFRSKTASEKVRSFFDKSQSREIFVVTDHEGTIQIAYVRPPAPRKIPVRPDSPIVITPLPAKPAARPNVFPVIPVRPSKVPASDKKVFAILRDGSRNSKSRAMLSRGTIKWLATSDLSV